jgi:urease accessory protein
MAKELTQLFSGSAANCCLRPERVGRDGSVCLGFVHRASTTVLARCRFELPLQVLAPVQQPDGSVYVLLLNPTGGVLGGDRLSTLIELGAQTHACLSTPSATRVYRTAGPPAVLETRIRVGAGAVLEYVPDLLIPHSGSAVNQKLAIELQSGSVALFTDGLAAGRLAHGERWTFREIITHTAVTRDTKPLFIDSFFLCPRHIHPGRLNLMEDYNYLVTFAVFTDRTTKWEELRKSIGFLFCDCPDVRGGTHLIASGGMICRFLGRSAIEVRAMLHRVWQTTRQLVCPSGIAECPRVVATAPGHLTFESATVTQ